MPKVQIPEWIKNLLIILLSGSALWLISQSPLYVGSPLEEKVSAFFSNDEVDIQMSVPLTLATKPCGIAVVTEGGRYGVQYDANGVNTAFDTLGTLLRKGLFTAGEPFPISEEDWRSALQQWGVYFDFKAEIPLSALTAWLSGDKVERELTHSIRRMALSLGEGENDVWLFWQNTSDSRFYACPTNIDRTLDFLPNLEMWIPNSSFFAFEDDSYAACEPYTLITSMADPAIYASTTPLSAVNTERVDEVLQTLAYSIAAGSSYAISGGIRYTDGINTFQLTNGGELTYHAADVSLFPISSEGEVPTLTECIETTRQLAVNTLGSLSGEAQLALLSVEESEEGLVITYGFRVGGVPVFLYHNGWAAQFTIVDNSITAFQLHFREYYATDATTLLLPELQAVAALSALETEKTELALSYYDTGAMSISAGWIAN